MNGDCFTFPHQFITYKINRFARQKQNRRLHLSCNHMITSIHTLIYSDELRDKAAKNSKKQLFPRTEELLLLERESFSAAFAG